MSSIGAESVPPFEFWALEVALKAICSFLDAKTKELESTGHPALDGLTKKAFKNFPSTYLSRSAMMWLYLINLFTAILLLLPCTEI
jgi:magnesium transporter